MRSSESPCRISNCFLGNSGQALAATGQRIPTRFGTWIWGCGFIPEKWIPTTTGANYAMPEDLKPLEPYRDRLAILSGFDVKLDGVPEQAAHHRLPGLAHRHSGAE